MTMKNCAFRLAVAGFALLGVSSLQAGVRTRSPRQLLARDVVRKSLQDVGLSGFEKHVSNSRTVTRVHFESQATLVDLELQAISIVRQTLEQTAHGFEALYQEGRIQEGYELCLSFIQAGADTVEAYVRRLVGLRALPLFAPPNSDWRPDAYQLLVATTKDPQLDVNTRKESFSALVGLRSLSLEVYPEETNYPVSVVNPWEALTSAPKATFLGDVLLEASFQDVAAGDPDLRQWVLESATVPATVERGKPRDGQYHMRLVSILALAALRGQEEFELLRWLTQRETLEDFRVQAVAAMIALAASWNNALDPDVTDLLAVEHNPRVLAVLVMHLDAIEKRYSEQVRGFLDRLIGPLSERTAFGLYGREIYANALRLAAFYHGLASTTPDERLHLRDQLRMLVVLAPSWGEPPTEIERLAFVDDPILQEELKAVLKALPNSYLKRRCLALLEDREV